MHLLCELCAFEVRTIRVKKGDMMGNHSLLIVDDEKNIIKSLARSLLQDEYSIIGALSGNEGLAKLKEHEVHLVISDQRMPGMTGLEFLKKVKVAYPWILTIMLTAHDDFDVPIEAINEAGVYKFILKPWNDNYLRLTIKRALESRQLIMERDALLQQVKNTEIVLKELEKRHPGITKVERDEHGTTVLKL